VSKRIEGEQLQIIEDLKISSNKSQKETPNFFLLKLNKK